jgi:hypothetical protein
MEPRLRTVNKAVPPFQMNKFPAKFIEHFGAEIAYMEATKETMSLEGNEWEQVFANCIGADWKPSNVGLDDVVLDNCCWGAKTVYASSKDLSTQQTVRLICGRNSPIYSYGEEEVATNADPDHIGKLVLDIWNERVSGIRQYFKFARTVVLVKGPNYDEYLIFETETVRYDADQFVFEWNDRGNLEGYTKEDHIHKFTWQPHGSQFTVIEEIPEERYHLKIKVPEKLDKASVLKTLAFDKSWVIRLK